jgi:hypothetical protein
LAITAWICALAEFVSDALDAGATREQVQRHGR